jgi:hypothetical protein
VCAKYFQTEEKDKKMTSDTTLEPKSWVLQNNNVLQFQRLSKKWLTRLHCTYKKKTVDYFKCASH